MDYEKLEAKIYEHIRDKRLDISAYTDMFGLIREIGHEEMKESHEKNHAFREEVVKGRMYAEGIEDYKLAMEFRDLEYKTLLYGARDYFDDYLQAIDFKKPYNKKFYLPRRGYLKRYVDAYQMILDGELDFLSVSMPKRCGKSQTGINFVNMISGREPNKSTLMEGTGDALVNSFYQGCLEYIQVPNDYAYYDIFPGIQLVQTSADTKIFNLDKRSRFPTVMCRSIDARQVGLSEATNLLYLDDCVEGREEAKNRQRLDDKWEVISGDVIGRAIEGTPIVICGTRYSLYDPIGRLQEEMKKQEKRMLILETPALDLEHDESNFEFELNGRKYFTTKYFRDQRMMLSSEQFESEFQQQPFEAKGLLFPKEALNYYYELPIDKDPDTVMAICDTAERGSDSTSMGIFKIYGNEIFFDDVVFDDSAPEITKPQCAKKIMEHGVVSGLFESNNAGEYYARDVEQMVRDAGFRCSIRTKRTISNKQTRIEMASDGIIKNFYFKHPSTYMRNSQYAAFMKELTTYTRSGKVPHDDAPDMLSIAENEFRHLGLEKVEVFDRPW